LDPIGCISVSIIPIAQEPVLGVVGACKCTKLTGIKCSITIEIVFVMPDQRTVLPYISESAGLIIGISVRARQPLHRLGLLRDTA